MRSLPGTVREWQLTVVERGTGFNRSVVNVELVDTETFYRVFDDVSAGHHRLASGCRRRRPTLTSRSDCGVCRIAGDPSITVPIGVRPQTPAPICYRHATSERKSSTAEVTVSWLRLGYFA
jgi:hypothetical protein